MLANVSGTIIMFLLEFFLQSMPNAHLGRLGQACFVTAAELTRCSLGLENSDKQWEFRLYLTRS